MLLARLVSFLLAVHAYATYIKSNEDMDVDTASELVSLHGSEKETSVLKKSRTEKDLLVEFDSAKNIDYLNSVPPEVIVRIVQYLGTWDELVAYNQTHLSAYKSLAPIFNISTACETGPTKTWPILKIRSSDMKLVNPLCMQLLKLYGGLFSKIELHGAFNELLFRSIPTIEGVIEIHYPSRDYYGFSESVLESENRLRIFLQGLRATTAESLAKALEKPDLKIVHLNYKTVGGSFKDDNSLEAVFAAIPKSKHLESVTLQTVQLSPSSVDALAKAIAESTVLKTLHIYGGTVAAEGKEIILRSFASSNIQKLLLSNFVWTKNQLNVFTSALPSSKIKVLELNNHFFQRYGEELKPLFLNNSIEHLKLAQNQIDVAVCKQLAKVIASSNLKTFDLSNNSLPTPAIAAIAPSLAALKDLQRLNFDFTGINNMGVLALSRNLYRFKKLRELSLANNDIGNKGAFALSNTIQKAPLLSSLDISFNEIGESGIASLKGCKQLRTLKTWGNVEKVICPEDTGCFMS